MRFLWYNSCMKNDTSTVTISTTEYENLKTENAELLQKVNWLMEQFRLSKHRQFGASSEKSEYDCTQLNLFNEAEITADKTAAEPELVEIDKHYRKRKRSAADRLPEDLPIEVIEHKLSESERICPKCAGALHIMSKETRRELVITPAQAKIHEHVREVCACRNCDKNSDSVPIVKAQMPEPVIFKSFASPEAVAHIMYQKFVMGAPLYRQEQDWNRHGIMLSRQTMSNWLIRATEDWLVPIYERLKQELMCRNILHADETTLQVLHEPGKTAQSKSYMWLYRTSGDTGQPIVLYEYQSGRHAKYPKKFLENFEGFLHTDGYDGYRDLPKSITVVGCWAHMRRYFDEALKVLPPKSQIGSGELIGKQYCDKLFALEKQFAEMPPDERFKERQKQSKQVLDEFFVWVDNLNILPKSLLGKAVHYAQSQRKYLERYLLDGRLEISNNRAERSIKPFVIGRKKFLFANTSRGASASAIMFSIIETAKENGLNPFEYLVHIFRTAPNLTKADLVSAESLLPWNAALRQSVQSPKKAG